MQRFEKYSGYKDSGVDWIGEIPERWEVKRIKSLSRVKRGASPRPIDNPKYFDDDGEFAWVRIADVSANEHYLVNTTQRLSKLGASLSVKIMPNELILSIAGTVGSPMVSNIKCCIHDGFVYFPDLEESIEYIYRIFETGAPYAGLGKFGTQLNLNTETVGSIIIPYPPISEQTAIVTFIDEKTTKIDTAIAQKEQMISLLKERKQILIQKAVTKGIDPDAQMKDSGVDW
ncbi:MAG: restriction endonuclease subunit S, partial [Candidatus Electrothrix sp. AR1]|nr:restriction endonuclease subunit S [Candidatus Electrothrix sp. AR1]